MNILKIPTKRDMLENMKVGDIFWISGRLITARDKAHERLINLHNRNKKAPIDLKNAAIIHCGPIARLNNGEWDIISAGPTTSYRMEKYEADLIKDYRVAVIIGKGGMGERTSKACREFGSIYATFTGGAGLIAAKNIKKVEKVFWIEDLGMPEALWVFDVEKFGPLVVTIDSEGNNLTEIVKHKARTILEYTFYQKP